MSVNSEKRENWEGEPKNNEESSQDGQLVGNSDEVVDDFDNMSLKEELLRGIYAYGIERPSAIQQKAIIPCIKGHDVAIQAQSSTGKTVAFSIAILQQINTTIRECQALILVLTRERALQIQEVVVTLGDFMGAVCHACVGGTDLREDVRKLKMGVHVLVGTPGRVFDMIRRRALKTNTIKIFVLDKADLISSRGFKDQIHNVFKTLPQEVQLVLLSAATPKYIVETTNFFMRQPKNFDMITIEPSNFGSYGLTPGELPANCKEKFETYNPSQFVDEGEENDDVEVMQGGGYKISFHVAKEFFAGIIGRQGSTRRQLEKETRTIITIPKTGQDGDIVVTGCVKNSVLSAKQRIEMIVLSMRKRQTYTHFVSLPFTNQSFKTGFLNFKTEVLEHCKARGIDETIFQNPDKLHLTVCVMALMDGVERKKAAGALFECKKHVIKPLLLNNPLEVEMVGVACMNDNPSKVDILYGKVKSNPNILQDLANGVLDYFVGKGLVWRQRDHVKLHVTLMNSKFRKRGEATDDRVKPETFDASQILRDYADFVFGAAVITQIELLLMPSVSDSESGYYRATATMPIP